MNVDEREKLIEEFQKKFPIEKLKSLTLEEYNNTQKKDSFCYWVETRLAKIGNIQGNNAFKFGIFEMLKKKDFSKKSILCDEKYAWYKDYGETAKSAFENVRKRIVAIAEAARANKLEVLDNLPPRNCCMFEWKVAFLYTVVSSPNRFVPIYWFPWLEKIAKDFVHDGEILNGDTDRSHLYEIIMKEQKDMPFWKYYDFLVKKYPKESIIPDDHKPEKKQRVINVDKNIDLLKANRNLIFHGAPGTGKTYLAKQIAARMIFGDHVPENFEQTEQFKTQCGFVQFHPSYDYTDFVEGLRPCHTGDSDSTLGGFVRQDGVFKKFCKKSVLQTKAETVSGEMGEKFVMPDDVTVWKVSLEGTGENDTRKDCMKNGYIRIGWPEYGAVDDFDEYKYNNDNSFSGKGVLRAFQKHMRVGDIVVSCFSEKETDAIGIIDGEYEFHNDGSLYPRYRKVKWLVKNIRENIIEANNGKRMTLSTVYKLGIKPSKIMDIVSRHSEDARMVHLKFSNPKQQFRPKPFVFIIDEINRGEVSKIFGELFFAIDPGYRGEKGSVQTQYQNLIEDGDEFKDGFYVPENVYIIGTMNDIDRSVESMDFAFRRRFAWKEIKAGDSKDMLDSLDSDGVPKEIIVRAKAKMDALNAAIAEHKELNESYQIGAAYFKRIKDYVGDDVSAEDYDDAFAKLWEYHLNGLLTEYLRGIEDGTSVEMFRKVYDEAGSASGGSEAPAES